MTSPDPGAARPVRVLGIAGSIRKDSYNRALLRAAVELVPPDLTIDIWDHVGELPLYNQDVESDLPAIVARLRDDVRQADALLFTTPEYNYSIPAPLKNLIDWASRPAATSPLIGKPAGIMGAATGMGGSARAQLALRQCFVFTRTYPLQSPEVIVVRAQEKFDAGLRLTDQKTRDFVAGLLVRLRDWTRLIAGRVPGSAQ